MRRFTLIPVALGAVSLIATALAPAANAVDPDTVVDGLVSPLSLAVGAGGTVYVSQNFASTLTAKAPGEDKTDLYADAAHREVGAVSVSGTTVTFATTAQGGPQDARLWTLADGSSTPTQVANLWNYERKHNPDGTRTYGILGLSKKCVRSIPKKHRQGIVAYKGIKESHPYASYVAGATTYVADAAANAIWSVDAAGVHTVATLPPVKAKVDKKLRKSFGLPKCTEGKTFKGEPVPTDVELGPDGNLYVTTLGGGLGESMPVGSVYQVAPTTGAVHKMAGGLMSPVGIAIEPTGTAYISLLFPGLIMKQPLGGDPEVFAEVPFPGDVEVSDGTVYATETDLTNDGTSPPAGKVLSWPTVAP